ncbi:MAG: hypothetical protein GOVbin4206_23 [Prokaryotic dsDNA virus sp.]|nr:MAG: hypothetical protein GOVbin4206_23 [Prokaryotic dsDNA virus sp.]|tara:strand:+ start:4500 stop:4880 length:381 start_codon:yes stop_codon:yes gene_type:complete
MGYRSYVYVITDIENKALIAALKAAKPDEEEEGIFKFWNMSSANRKTKEVMLFEFHETKWYESYDDVKAVMSEINKLENDKTKCGSFGYIQIGENDDDITHLGSPWDYDMHLNRSVDMPFLERKEE